MCIDRISQRRGRNSWKSANAGASASGSPCRAGCGQQRRVLTERQAG